MAGLEGFDVSEVPNDGEVFAVVLSLEGKPPVGLPGTGAVVPARDGVGFLMFPLGTPLDRGVAGDDGGVVGVVESTRRLFLGMRPSGSGTWSFNWSNSSSNNLQPWRSQLSTTTGPSNTSEQPTLSMWSTQLQELFSGNLAQRALHEGLRKDNM